MKIAAAALHGCGLILLSNAPSFATAAWFPERRGKGRQYGDGCKHGVSRLAPDPVTGAGTSDFAALGGHTWHRRRHRGK
jgi:hypothetical protein